MGDDDAGPSSFGGRAEKVLAHPIRQEIVRLLASRAASMAEIADVLDVKAGSASYHCSVLAAEGLIEVGPQRAGIQGAPEFIYHLDHAAVLGMMRWTGAPPGARAEAISAFLPEFLARMSLLARLDQEVVKLAAGAGHDPVFSWHPLELDRAGEFAVVEEMRKVASSVRRIHRESFLRSTNSEEVLRPFALGIAWFDRSTAR